MLLHSYYLHTKWVTMIDKAIDIIAFTSHVDVHTVSPSPDPIPYP